MSSISVCRQSTQPFAKETYAIFSLLVALDVSSRQNKHPLILRSQGIKQLQRAVESKQLIIPAVDKKRSTMRIASRWDQPFTLRIVQSPHSNRSSANADTAR